MKGAHHEKQYGNSVDVLSDGTPIYSGHQADLDNGGNLPASATGLEAESGQVTFAWVSSRLAEISDRLANSAPMRVELAEALIEIDALAKFLRVGGDPAFMRAMQDNGPAKHG